MKCKICNQRKARRYCPGIGGDICSICCGTEREVTVDCPLDCQYLIEAHLHEKVPELDLKSVPNQDIQVTEAFMESHAQLLAFLGAQILEAARTTPGAVDRDVQDAIESLVRTYRTLHSGLYYETKPSNLVAAAIQEKVQTEIQSLRKTLTEKSAGAIRDADILGVLVFLERIAFHQYNGRPKGKAFLAYLNRFFTQMLPEQEAAPSLIQI
jgi:hypothetical protein